uniref:Transmembrane protein n=1 Tax=Arabidopsis thaliana TaxID=3702 RepID=Q56ZA0_ARATH|nr:hypothetical protein [Arabidopsis thaliana]
MFLVCSNPARLVVVEVAFSSCLFCWYFDTIWLFGI